MARLTIQESNALKPTGIAEGTSNKTARRIEMNSEENRRATFNTLDTIDFDRNLAAATRLYTIRLD